MAQHVEIHDHGMGKFELKIDGAVIAGIVDYHVEHALREPARVHVTLIAQRCDVDVDGAEVEVGPPQSPQAACPKCGSDHLERARIRKAIYVRTDGEGYEHWKPGPHADQYTCACGYTWVTPVRDVTQCP